MAMRDGRWLRLGVAVLGLLVTASASAEPVKIRIGWSTMPGHLIPVLFSKPEILKHYGTSYTVEPILFRGSSPQITAMAAGELDMAAFSPAVLALAVNNAGQDIKAVADIIQDGTAGYHSETYLVDKDSGISAVADLKGKRVGTNAFGSSSDTAMRTMLRNKGLVDKRDYTSIEVAFSNMPAMMGESKIDMGTVLQPFSDQMLKSGRYKVLFTAAEAVGPSELVFLAARADFLDAHRPEVQDFIEDYVRAVRWFVDPKNRTEAIRIIAAFMKQKPEDLDYLFTKADYYRDPWMVPNVANIQSMVDASQAAGVLQAPFKVAPDAVDLSLVAEAKRRIEASGGTP